MKRQFERKENSNSPAFSCKEAQEYLGIGRDMVRALGVASGCVLRAGKRNVYDARGMWEWWQEHKDWAPAQTKGV